MQYQKPGFIMNLASNKNERENSGANYLLRVRVESNRWLLNHLSSYLSHEQSISASLYIQSLSGLLLTEAELNEMLALFPAARIELAVHGISKIEVQHHL